MEQGGEESGTITAVWTPRVGVLVTERGEMCLSEGQSPRGRKAWAGKEGEVFLWAS